MWTMVLLATKPWPWIAAVVVMALSSAVGSDARRRRQGQGPLRDAYDDNASLNTIEDDAVDVPDGSNGGGDGPVLEFTKPEYDAWIPENSMAKTFVTPSEKMGIRHPPSPGFGIRYKIVGGDPDRFFKAEERTVGDFTFLLIRTKTGNTNVLNRERRDSYRLEVKARVVSTGSVPSPPFSSGDGVGRRKNGGGGGNGGAGAGEGPWKSATTIVSVKITDVNDFSPLFIPPARYEVEVPEDTPLHTSILQVSVFVGQMFVC